MSGLVRRGRGAVLNVASTVSFQPLPGQAAYGAAKAFVLSYTRSLADEVARQAIDGLAKGRPVVIPGVANKLGAGLCALKPKRLLVPLLARSHPALKRPS